ncbi:MAG: AAA family ATPase [Myxococcota bacterium]
MRLDRIELKNFRGFEHFELELHPRFTLLIGGNGSGKTNALEGLAVGLGEWIRSGIERATRENRRVEQHDIRLERIEYEGALGLEPRIPMHIRIAGQFGPDPISWSVSVRGDEAASEDIPERGERTVVPSTYAGSHLATVLLTHPDGRPEEGHLDDYPLVAYYGTERLWSERDEFGDTPPVREESHLGSRRRGYHSALASKVSGELFPSWMAWRTQVELQRLASLVKANRVPQSVPRDPLLEAVETAIVGCIEGARRFFFDVSYQELRLELADGQLIPFSRLSDGYRNLIAMVADIAWRAAQLNPHHGANAAREATGVVLIDELELHLHPAWQRRVIDDLLAAFPKLQFVATTHSPQIIASARLEYMWLLYEGNAQRPGPIHGKDSNAILRDIMGVPERPAWMKDRLDRLARLIEGGEAAEAKTLLTEIQMDLGDDDPTVAGLQWELHDLEHQGGEARPKDS